MEQSEFKSLSDWRKADPQMYNIAYNRKMLNTIADRYGWARPFNYKYWTKERVIEEAIKYTNREEWKTNNPESYSIATRRGWSNECVRLMNKTMWEFDTCLSEALKCFTQRNSLKNWRTKLKKFNSFAYNTAKQNSWLTEIIKLVRKSFNKKDYRPKKLSKPRVLWTKELCLEDALKYKTRSSWFKSYGAFKAAKKNGWYNDCIKHMVIIKKTDWTFDDCHGTALKYKTKREWYIKHPQTYNFASRRKWLIECTKHMIPPQKNWKSLELCLANALLYRTKSDWIKKSHGCAKSAEKNGWMDECTKHMVSKQKPNGYWLIKDNVLTESKKFSTLTEWRRSSKMSYFYARKNSWMDECKINLEKNKNRLYFTTLKLKVIFEAQSFDSIAKWRQAKRRKGYKLAIENDWIDRCTRHMVDYNKSRGYWKKKKNIFLELKKYSSFKEWRMKDNRSYSAMYRNGWKEDCKNYMKRNCIKEFA